MTSDDCGSAISRDRADTVVESAGVGDTVRVRYRTGLPEQSAFQPDQTELTLTEDGRYHYVNILGDPIWLTPNELAEELATHEYAVDVEVVHDD